MAIQPISDTHYHVMTETVVCPGDRIGSTVNVAADAVAAVHMLRHASSM